MLELGQLVYWIEERPSASGIGGCTLWIQKGQLVSTSLKRASIWMYRTFSDRSDWTIWFEALDALHNTETEIRQCAMVLSDKLKEEGKTVTIIGPY